MVRAESSQSISLSLPVSWSRRVLWCAARMRNTPRMIMNTRKLTHTTITTVAVLGTTASTKHSSGHWHCANCHSPAITCQGMWLYTRIVWILLHFILLHKGSLSTTTSKVSRKVRTRPQLLKYNYINLKDWKHNESTSYHTQTPLWIAYFSSSHILHPCQINAIKTERARYHDSSKEQHYNSFLLPFRRNSVPVPHFLEALQTPSLFQHIHTNRKLCWQEREFHRVLKTHCSLPGQQQSRTEQLPGLLIQHIGLNSGKRTLQHHKKPAQLQRLRILTWKGMRVCQVVTREINKGMMHWVNELWLCSNVIGMFHRAGCVDNIHLGTNRKC